MSEEDETLMEIVQYLFGYLDRALTKLTNGTSLLENYTNPQKNDSIEQVNSAERDGSIIWTLPKSSTFAHIKWIMVQIIGYRSCQALH